MNLLDNLGTTENVPTVWLANMLVITAVIILGTMAVARYFSVL